MVEVVAGIAPSFVVVVVELHVGRNWSRDDDDTESGTDSDSGTGCYCTHFGVGDEDAGVDVEEEPGYR